MKTVKINLYEFKELSAKAQQKAIEEHREFILSTMNFSDFISGDDEYDTEENIQKEFEEEVKYYEQSDEPIIENIELNEYLFYPDGKLANCTTYCGEHEKAGITELKIGDIVYTVE